MAKIYANNNIIQAIGKAASNPNLLTIEVLSEYRLTDFTGLDFGSNKYPSILIEYQTPTIYKYTIKCDSPTKIYISPAIVDYAMAITMNIPSTVTDVTNMLESSMSSQKTLKTITFTEVDTSNIVTMEGMFIGCGGLTSLDVSKFNTKNVTNMAYMFFSCDHLLELNLSNFDTTNVEDMSSMFSSCGAESSASTTSIIVDGWNTSKVKFMGGMFENTKVQTLNLNSFNTGKVIDMWCMFFGCQQLQSLNISNFSLASIERYDEEDRDTLAGLFNYTNKLTLNNIDMSNCDQETKTTLTEVFNNRQI
jgi:surface protein